MTSWFKSLWSGRTGNEDDDTKKPPAAGGMLSRGPPPPTPEQAKQKLKRAMAVVNKQVLTLEEAVEKQESQIRRLMQAGNKKEAARLVPTLKRDQRRLDQERAKLNNLRDQMGMTDGVQTARVVAEAYKVSTEASRIQMGEFDRDEIDRVMEDSRELKQDMEDINSLLGEGMSTSSGQDRLNELEAEEYLEQMMQEDEDLLRDYEKPAMPRPPSPVAAVQTKEPTRKLVSEQGK